MPTSTALPTAPTPVPLAAPLGAAALVHATRAAPSSAALDRLSPLLERFRVHAHLFHTGALCGVSHFPAQPGRAFVHVLRRGTLRVQHPHAPPTQRWVQVDEPSLLFYPRPWEHHFHNPPHEGSDFTCATLDFEGGAQHPLVRALPSVLVLPLAQVRGLEATLSLLFAETEQLRCGQRLLADRLFEVLLLQLLRWVLDHAEALQIHTGLIAALADPALARALTAMHTQPGQAWTLQALATCAGLSRSVLAARFRARMDQTVWDYLTDWRLSLAQSGLRQGQPLQALATDLGYANASALSRVFSQRLGLSPRAWLAQQKVASISAKIST